MTLTNGTDTLTYSNASIEEEPVIESGEQLTAGGRIVTHVAGERYSCTALIRLTGAQYGALLTFIKQSDYIFFTPTYSTLGINSHYTFPMRVAVKQKAKHRVGGQPYYGVELQIESVRLI